MRQIGLSIAGAGLVLPIAAAGLLVTSADAAGHRPAAQNSRSQRCPWTSAADSSLSPRQRAQKVLQRLNLSEKLVLVDLSSAAVENYTGAVSELCIPSLTLQDGPNGLAYNDRGVSQLPASLGIAASFSPRLAQRYGEVIATEARGQGIDVIQGPNLNVDRVPESGRSYEGYGEDPMLISAMGDAAIEGIQSMGVMAEAKHFTAYTQETDRINLDQRVAKRALEEIYLAPFKSAVKQAHVAALMCAYGKINGVLDCGDPNLYRLLDSWGFNGFVRSDLDAVDDSAAVPSFVAGLDVVKPTMTDDLAAGVQAHSLSMARLDNAVTSVLRTMFSYGLIARPRPLRIDKHVASATDARFALHAAEQTMVLLRNEDQLLPLKSSLSSIAIIGTDSSTNAETAGHGGAHVIPPFISTPLAALRKLLGSHKVHYAPGASAINQLPPIPDQYLHDESMHTNVDYLHSSLAQHHGSAGSLIGTGPFSTRALASLFSYKATFVAPASGLFDFSVTDHGNTWFSIDGKLEISSVGVHGKATWSTAIEMAKGRAYELALDWYPPANNTEPVIGMAYETPLIAQAVKVARHAQVALVFVRDYSSEAFDRPNLSLPGAQNALVDAVTKANPNTVVVVNSGGPVLMPWINKVKSVLEAWYPGEQDGNATMQVLFGNVDPAGRLPVTFPRAQNQTPLDTASEWPGVDGVVSYREGIDVGYRYYDAHHLTALFPFGYGLSYTSFALSNASLSSSNNGATVEVKNTGKRAGTEVVEAYVRFPASAGEPPKRLIAFGRVYLNPGQSAPVTLSWSKSSLQCYLGGHLIVPKGNYQLMLGESSRSLNLAVGFTVS